MNLLSTGLSAISFDSLNFLVPYSQISNCNRHKGRVVLLDGLSKSPGILVTRYIDNFGVCRHIFSSIKISLNSAAGKIYTLLREKNIKTISFAVLPMLPRHHPVVLKKLKCDYFQQPLDDHFSLINQWLMGERKDKFPIESLVFRRVFDYANGYRRFTLHDYENRGGLYVVREYLVHEDKQIDVYVGKSKSVLSDRIEYKFYPNHHLFYEDIPGIKEYYVAPIEIKKSFLPRRTHFDKALRRYEKSLTNILDARDNKLGRTSILLDTTLDGYVPVHKGKGMPF